MAAITTRISHEDFVDDSTTTLTASSTASGSAVANLQSDFVAKTWQATGKTDENVVFDLGSAKNTKVAGIFGHNFTSAATVTLQANATDSWGAPTYSQALTVEVDALSDVIPKIVFFLDQTYRYWRIRIQDTGNANNVEMGRVWLGSYFQPTYNFNSGFRVDVVKPDFVERPDIGGPYGAKRPSYEVISFGWDAGTNPLPTADRETMEAIWRKVGKTLPTLLVYDSLNDPSVTGIFGFFENDGLARSHGVTTNFGTEGLVLREEVGWNYT